MKSTKHIGKRAENQPATIHPAKAHDRITVVDDRISVDDSPMSRKVTKAIAFGALLHTGFGFGIAPIHAESMYTTRPGTECVEHRDTSPEIYYTGGNAANDAAGSNTFVCPASTDYLDLDQLGDFQFDRVQWYVVVDDRHPSSNVTCYLRSCNQTGTSCSNSPSRSSSNTGIHTLPMTSAFQWGDALHYAYLRCSVPGKYNNARSSIKSYTLVAFD